MTASVPIDVENREIVALGHPHGIQCNPASATRILKESRFDRWLNERCLGDNTNATCRALARRIKVREACSLVSLCNEIEDAGQGARSVLGQE